jgi:hypothetical protein
MRHDFTSRVMLTQNSRLWISENSHALQETPLHDQKVGVWVAISRRRILGPLFIEDTVNSERYSSMLYDFIGRLSKTNSPTPSFNKMALLRTQLTTL